MNHIFRVVWNSGLGSWVAAAETAKGRVRSASAGSGRAALSVAPLFVLTATAWAAGPGQPTVQSVTPGTSALVAGNGATVFNVANPNAQGLSHNQFTRYDVDSKGLVLNNATSASGLSALSQLAGRVGINTGLSRSASVILNEVVSNNRSTLAGFTEVLGGRADVIVANPYGITCSGCGFINTDRVTLSSGVPRFDEAGRLQGLDVSRGDIRITGEGLNANAQQVLDLVARSVQLEGPVHAQDLMVVLGSQGWSYGDRQATASLTAQGETPLYALDSSTLGGMYAQRIRLMATDSGVGVRMRGDMAASVADVQISVSGQVELRGKVSAQGSVDLRSSHAGERAILLADASVSAKQDVRVDALGALQAMGAQLFAGRDLVMQAAQASAGTSAFQSGQDLSWRSLAGELSLGDSAMQAGRHLSLDAGGSRLSTQAASGQAIVSLAGDVSLRAGHWVHGGQLSAEGGVLRVHADQIDHLGVSQARSGLEVSGLAADGVAELHNTGRLQSDADMTLKLGRARNDAGAKVQARTGSRVSASSLDNQGSWVTSTQALAGSDVLALSGGWRNTGEMASARALSVEADHLDNQGVVSSDGPLSIKLRDQQGLVQGAQAVMRSRAGLDLEAQRLNNAGTLFAQGLMRLQGGAASPMVGLLNSGRLVTDGRLEVAAQQLENLGLMQARQGTRAQLGSLLQSGSWVLSAQAAASPDDVRVAGSWRQSGVTQSAGGLLAWADAWSNTGSLVVAQDLVWQGSGAATLDNGGTWLVGGRAELRAASLVNRGRMHARGDWVASGVDGAASLDLHNLGQLSTDGSLSLSADEVRNDTGGVVQAGQGTTLQAREGRNAGTWIGSMSAGARSSWTLTGAWHNSGTMSASGDWAWRAWGLDNLGEVWVGGDLDLVLTGAGVDQVSLNNTKKAGLRARALSIWATGQVSNAGAVAARGGLLSLTAHALSNEGTLYGQQGLALQGTSGALASLSNSGQMLSDGALGVRALQLHNLSAGWVQAAHRSDIWAGSFTQEGNWFLSTTAGAAASTIEVSGLFTQAGLTHATGGHSVSAQRLSNSGQLLGDGAMSIRAGELINQSTGRILSIGDIDVQADSLDNRGQWAADGDVTMVVKGLLSNSSRLQSGSTLDVQAKDVVQNEAALMSAQALKLRAQTLVLKARSTLSTQGKLDIGVGSLDNTDSSRIMGSLNGSSLLDVRIDQDFRNFGLIYSGNALRLNAPNLVNELGAAISGLGQVEVSSGKDLVNWGTLWSAEDLHIEASNGLFSNRTDEDHAQGVVEGKTVVIRADHLLNESTINARQDLFVEARVFENKLRGDWTVQTYRFSEEGGSDPSWVEDGKGGSTWEYTRHWVTWGTDQVLGNGYTNLNGLPTFHAQMTAGGTLSITGFQTALNHGGTLSAKAIHIESDRSNATFTNNSLELKRYGHRKTRVAHIHWCWNHLCKHGEGYGEWNEEAPVLLKVRSFGAGVYADKLTGGGFGLSLNGTPKQAAVIGGPDVTPPAPGGTPGGSVFLGDDPDRKDGGPVGNVASNAKPVEGVTETAAQVREPVRPDQIGLPPGVSHLQFGGIRVSLPGGGNGQYITIADPRAKYLVETNPLYLAAGQFAGSDLLTRELGWDPDRLIKRMGDGNYEALLVRQQVAAQTGRTWLADAGYSDAQQMRTLMSQAVKQSGELGFTYGEPLSAAQQAALKSDVVWMVKTQVGDQVVLAPVVYLSKQTLASIDRGSVIAANDVQLAVSRLDNNGGTLSGDRQLTVVSQGDIVNLSGAIKGGNVSLASTSGDIVNRTLAQERNGQTVVGPEAVIASTGNLQLKAGGDIDNIGARMQAGGSASLVADGAITFDSIAKRSSSESHQSTQKDGVLTTQHEKTASVTQVKSTLSVGRDLVMDAGKEIVLAGSDVTAAGNADLQARDGIQVINRMDTTQTQSRTDQSGWGVGGGVWGTSKTTTDTEKGKVVASTLQVGGNLSARTSGDLLVQGSKVDAKGEGVLQARDVKAIDAHDYSKTTSVTDTTSLLKVVKGEGKSDSKSSAEAQAKHNADQQVAQAGAGAQASAEAEGKGGLAFVSNTRTESSSESTQSRGSSVSFGKGATVQAQREVLLRGSDLKAGGALDVSAQNVTIQAGQNTETSRTSTTETNIGLMARTTNSADADAQAAARADRATSVAGTAGASAGAGARAATESELRFVDVQTSTTEKDKLTHTGSELSGGSVNLRVKDKLQVAGSQVKSQGDLGIQAGSVEITTAEDRDTTKTTRIDVGIGLLAGSRNEVKGGAQATTGNVTDMNASAEGSASSQNKLSLLKVDASSESSRKVTHVASGLSAGGDMKLDVKDDLRVKGSDIQADGSAVIQARNQRFEAAQDLHEKSSTRNVTTTGLYLDAEAKAGAKGQVLAGADASAQVEGGYFVNNSGSKSTEGSTTARVSSIRTGGDLTRVAQGNITDVGTAIEVGGDMTQKADTISSLAAKNTSYSSTESHQSEGRYGLYAGASAGASVNGGADADASVGARVRAEHQHSVGSSQASEAVASTIQVGGKLSSTSKGQTLLEGTQLDAGGDVRLQAGSLKVEAARDTASATQTDAKAAVAVTVNVNAKSVVGGEVSASGEGSTTQSQSSTARVASLGSGGKLQIVTDGDASFEGTKLRGSESTSVNAGGNVTFDAATSTRSETTNGASASFGIGGATGGKADKQTKGGTVSLQAGYNHEDQQASTQQAASVQGGSIDIRSGGNTRLVGTELAAQGDIGIAAKGDLKVEAKRDTASVVSVGVGLSVGAGKEQEKGAGKVKTESSVTGGTQTDVSVQKSSVEKGAIVLSQSGNVRLSSGGDTTLVGTQVSAEKGTASVLAGGQVVEKDARTVREAGGAKVGLTMTVKETQTRDETSPPPAGKTPPVTPPKPPAGKTPPTGKTPPKPPAKPPVPPKASEKPTNKVGLDDAQASFNAQRRDSTQATNIKAGSVDKRSNVSPP